MIFFVGAFKKKPKTLQCFKEDVDFALLQHTANGTESPTVATQDLIPYLETHQTSDSIEIEVMETESSIQELGPVMETESIIKTTEDSNLMPERQQHADSTEMEDSDLQPEISSSNDDDEVDPDFDFDKELKSCLILYL